MNISERPKTSYNALSVKELYKHKDKGNTEFKPFTPFRLKFRSLRPTPRSFSPNKIPSGEINVQNLKSAEKPGMIIQMLASPENLKLRVNKSLNRTFEKSVKKSVKVGFYPNLSLNIKKSQMKFRTSFLNGVQANKVNFYNSVSSKKQISKSPRMSTTVKKIVIPKDVDALSGWAN